MEFTLGSGQLIPGFEKAVEGMEKGESTKVTIPSEEVYGEPREDLIISVPRENMPDGVTPELGMQLKVNHQDGQTILVRITESAVEELKLAANYPLSGKDLTFDIKLMNFA